MVRCKGAQQLRQRLLYATLSGTTLRVDDIRAKDQSPGLRDYEASLLRLLEKITSGCIVEINETGTRLRYTPGVLTGGKGLVHDCGTGRAVGYFLGALVILGLYGKRPLTITLRGITNDGKDPGVDTLRTVTLPLLKRFGVPTEDLELKIVRRGAPPLGGGEVQLKVPQIQSLESVQWVDEGLVKRVRGVAYSTRVSPQMANRMVDAARAVLNSWLPDVYIFTDHVTGQDSGKAPGYGISLVAETTSGCLLGSDHVALRGEAGDGSHTVTPAEDVGREAAEELLGEVRQGGVVDSTHQGLLLLLCALCPNEYVCKVRVGPLTPHAIRCLRDIKEFIGVQFKLQPEPSTGTVLASCVGAGIKNMSRKVS